jgi:hypothetical protein
MVDFDTQFSDGEKCFNACAEKKKASSIESSS